MQPSLTYCLYYILKMESINNTPLLILRQASKEFKAKQKRLDRRVRSKQLLQEEIYSNHNIFQSNVNLYRNMTAQNIIWDKNYNFKCVINQIKEENSSLKARIWNVEKENRRMERQIEAWNLNDYAQLTNQKKLYIDMATFSKVISDQDYSIVSMKMQIFQLQKQLQQKQQQHSHLLKRIGETPKLLSLLNHQISQKKVEIYNSLGQQKLVWKNQFESESKDKMSAKLLKQNQQFDLISKNAQINKKCKINIERDLETVGQQCESHKHVSSAQIDHLKEQIKQLRASEDGGAASEREKLKLIKKKVSEYECSMQSQMDRLIKIKIPLHIEIQELQAKLKQLGEDVVCKEGK